MADCGKRWEEDPTCGSSFPKVVSGGHQQFTPSQTQSKTNSSSPPSKTYAQTTNSPKTKYPPKSPPKQPTPSKVRSDSPGREKFEKLLDFKKRLDQERKSSSRPEPSQSTPSSPKQPRTIRPPTIPPQRSMPPPSMTTLKPSKKGPIFPLLPLDSPPITPPPTANEPAATSSSAVSSPTATSKKWQWSSSIESSKQQRKKEKPRHHTGSNICQVNKGVLARLHKVQLQLLKDLRVLHNFKEVNGRNVEDPRNFPNAWITLAIRKGRASEGVMKMFGEANEALSPISIIKDDLQSCKGLVGRVPFVLHPSLYRAVKLTFRRDIGGLAHDGAITNEMVTGSMSQTVGVLTPAMFSQGTQPL